MKTQEEIHPEYFMTFQLYYDLGKDCANDAVFVFYLEAKIRATKIS